MIAAFLGGLLAGLVILLVLVIWSIRRHRDPDLHIECESPIDELMPTLAGLTLGTTMAGNTAEVLENGAFFDVLIGRIQAARESVHFETFLWKEGTLGRRVADALIDRARTGVKVRVLLDAEGSKSAGETVVRQMRDAGCRVVFFHERRLRNIGVFNDRDHRKLVVIDGREAFVGGHCIVDEWLGNAEDGKHNGDVSLHLHGPIVHSVQSAFSENWAGETGELFVGDGCVPDVGAGGRHPDARRVREARELGSGGEDTPPHCDLPGAQTHLDPESLFHPRARCHRRLRQGGGAAGWTCGF